MTRMERGDPNRRAWIAIAIALLLTVTAVSALKAPRLRQRIQARFFSADNGPVVVPAPADFRPQVLPGFRVSVFARGFEQPRWLAVAPNGDVFVADSKAGQVVVLHDREETAQPAAREVFADHLTLPFGIAFHEGYVYVADTNEVLRFRYDPQTSRRLGEREHVLDLPGLGYNQHWSRSLAFSEDGRRMFVSVGSQGNVAIEPDPRRAAILTADPDGRNMRIYAAGVRNAVGLGVHPETGELWASVNERDNLGDDVPSDYFTHVAEGGFYGWPYSYLGSHLDYRVAPRPDLVAKAIVPDVLVGAHVAALEFAFYEGQQFPAAYRGGAFLAEHGSWNRRARSGYRVVFVPFEHGRPSGKAQPFLWGFAPDPADKNVYGRPVGVVVAADGSILISDDGGNLIWRVSFASPS